MKMEHCNIGLTVGRYGADFTLSDAQPQLSSNVRALHASYFKMHFNACFALSFCVATMPGQ